MSKLRVKEIAHSNSTNAATVASDGALTFAKNISQTDLQWWSGFHDTNTTYSTQYATITSWTKHGGNGITESAGVWTIPVAGVYIFNLSMLIQDTNGGVYWNYAPSGGGYTRKWRIIYGDPPSTNEWQNCSGTVMHEFSAGDRLKFTVQNGATKFYGAGSTDSVSSMSIFKVG
jgi:hypothetical protein